MSEPSEHRSRKKALRLKLNSLFKNARGEMDGFVVRTFRGKQFLQRKPTFTREWGAGTVQQRGKFGAAEKWYQEVVKPNPELVALYREKGKAKQLNYRQMALGDFMNAPEVRGVDFVPPEKHLYLDVYDDFELVRVTVVFRDADGSTLYEADIERQDNLYLFHVPASVEGARAPVSIEITAWDRPGNKTSRTFPMPVPRADLPPIPG